MIDLEHIQKYYQMGENRVYALTDITLHIEEGEFVSIIGPSGSGKSTLMNILGCLDIPSAGTYCLDGKLISAYTENQLADIRNQKIGFVFQGFNLLSKLTAVENVELPLIYRGVAKNIRLKMAMQALESVGLLERAKHKPSELSGGQQQRVAIARALVSKPRVVLADEPTGNLDSHAGEDIMKILTNFHAQGATVILITHDQLIAKLADRIITIFDGQIVADSQKRSASI